MQWNIKAQFAFQIPFRPGEGQIIRSQNVKAIDDIPVEPAGGAVKCPGFTKQFGKAQLKIPAIQVQVAL